MKRMENIIYYAPRYKEWVIVSEYIKYERYGIFLKLTLDTDGWNETKITLSGYRVGASPQSCHVHWQGLVENLPIAFMYYSKSDESEFKEAEAWNMLDQIS